MTFYFYDLETSGFSPRTARIMQFAGQRTDQNLKPLGKPDNILIKLTPDILPEPYAVMVHGISPQKTLNHGITEAEFAKCLTSKVCTPGTVMVGFNNIRFDDEFIRYLLWRNFHDAYEWHWKDDRGRWDLLDALRMMRALRPEGIQWPVDSDGKPSNRLELLSKINKLDHDSAHDALSDVKAVIALAQLLMSQQPKLFKYLMNIRDKNKVRGLVTTGEPFVYTSGRYPSKFQKTTIALMVAGHPERDAALVYDLRVDPEPFLKMSSQDLAEAWKYRPKRHYKSTQVVGEVTSTPAETEVDISVVQQTNPEEPYFPIKVLSYNRCPAIAPFSVLTSKNISDLQIDKSAVNQNLEKLKNNDAFGEKIIEALELIQPQKQTDLVIDEYKVDELLYESFVNADDKTKMRVVKAAKPEDLGDLNIAFADQRLKHLLPLYKARNFPGALNKAEKAYWEMFKKQKLTVGLKSPISRFKSQVEELESRSNLTGEQKALLADLDFYAKSVLP